MHRTLALLLSCAAFGVATSCSADRAAAPAGDGASERRAPRGRHYETLADSVDVIAACPRHGLAIGAGAVGPKGGRVSAGGVELVVPPGALDADVPIIALLPGGTTSEVHFEPHGLRFNRPVRLVLPGAGCALDGGSLMVDYLDDDGTVLERLPAHRDPLTGDVSTEIRHFSIYAVAVRQGSAPQ